MESAPTIRPGLARFVLAVLVVILVSGTLTQIPAQPVSADPDKADTGLHKAVAERLRKGEPYYAALGAELRQRGYPSASVFNWRMPLVFQVYAAAPYASHVTLIALGLLAVILTVFLLRRASPEATLTGILLQVGSAGSVVLIPGSATVAEAWLGYVLLASVCAYVAGRPLAGSALAVLALFVRELAAPFWLLCAVVALRHRRRGEIAVLALGAIAFGAYYVVHVMHVLEAIAPGDLAHHDSWIRFGGLPFVLGTLSFNGWFAISQPWGPTLGVVLILAAPWARRVPWPLTAPGPLYLAFFAIVGQPFNQNWGLVASPLWALSCGFGVMGLERLARAAFGRQRENEASTTASLKRDVPR